MVLRVHRTKVSIGVNRNGSNHLFYDYYRRHKLFVGFKNYYNIEKFKSYHTLFIYSKI